ncbi:hypothetical protein D3C79_746450 [compost metagenome]
MADTGEDADHLQVALHTHQVAGTLERLEVGLHRDAGSLRLLPVVAQPAFDPRLRPAEEGVLEQAGDVVGDRAVHGILEVQHSGVGRALHQVARHVVAVHQNLGLGECAVDQQLADSLPGGFLGIAEGQAKLTAHVPLREQLDFTAQQRIVVAGQRRVHRQALERQQRVDGIGEQAVGVVGINDIKVCLVAQVTQQQEATLQVLGMDQRHVHAGAGQQVVDGDERSAVFLRRWCIHDHEAVAGALPAEITTEAGIAAGRGQAACGHFAPGVFPEKIIELLIEPDRQLLQAYIVFRHYKGLRRP